jgi:(p)ppGpp synthase/HD superfamily hydrolase
MSDLIVKAEAFARDRHAGQFYAGKPYADAHLAKVAELTSVLSDGNSKAIAVAWLHDTLEDTETTRSELIEFFGQDTADQVELLTRIDDDETAYLTQLADLSSLGQIVKLADISVNLNNIGTKKGDRGAYVSEKIRELRVLMNRRSQIKTPA